MPFQTNFPMTINQEVKNSSKTNYLYILIFYIYKALPRHPPNPSQSRCLPRNRIQNLPSQFLRPRPTILLPILLLHRPKLIPKRKIIRISTAKNLQKLIKITISPKLFKYHTPHPSSFPTRINSHSSYCKGLFRCYHKHN